MKRLIPALLAIISLQATGQYYYKDIIGTSEMNFLASLYKTHKVRAVSAVGFDEQGVQSRDFYERQVVSENGSLLKIESRSGVGQLSNVYYRFDGNARLTSITDTTDMLASTTTYTYGPGDMLILLKNVIIDTSLGINEVEEHRWEYNSEGVPLKMLRIYNNDTTELRFKHDAAGNVTEEQVYKKGRPGEVIHYYYNDEDQLTDIVRYNTKARRLLPDFMFEYSEKGEVIQKITTMQNLNIGYLIWRYQFDDRGLKIREANFTKDRKMIGKIEYHYTF